MCYPVHRFECAALEYTLSNHPPPFTTSLVPATRRDPNETSSSLLDQSMRVSACQTSFFIHPSQSTPLCIHFSPITRNSLRSRRETRRSLSLCQPRWLFLCNWLLSSHLCGRYWSRIITNFERRF